jgi:uncharacterized protein
VLVSVSEDRHNEARRVCDLAVTWAEADPSVRAVGLAGSYARGAGRADSDVDLVILAVHLDQLLDDDAWHERFCDVRLVRAERFGILVERRLRLPSGLDIEVGIAPLEWCGTDPVDTGTRRVVREGFRILYDPDGLLRNLVDAVGP